jgi:hypothetical protein
MPMPITLGRSYATNAQSGHHLKTPNSRGEQVRKISNRLSQSIQRACALHYFVRHASFLILIQIGMINLNYSGT